jgi:hypothetical protein
MSATVSWQGGGTAVIDVIDDDRVELVSTRAFAPGSRPEGTVAIFPGSSSGETRSAGEHAIWLKVHGSRRQDDGAFRVKGRLLNVRRQVLDLLKEVVLGSNDGKSSTS